MRDDEIYADHIDLRATIYQAMEAIMRLERTQQTNIEGQPSLSPTDTLAHCA